MTPEASKDTSSGYKSLGDRGYNISDRGSIGRGDGDRLRSRQLTITDGECHLISASSK